MCRFVRILEYYSTFFVLVKILFHPARYLQPMRAGRLLDSPRHAARFVSLLPFEKDEALGGGKYASFLILPSLDSFYMFARLVSTCEYRPCASILACEATVVLASRVNLHCACITILGRRRLV